MRRIVICNAVADLPGFTIDKGIAGQSVMTGILSGENRGMSWTSRADRMSELAFHKNAPLTDQPVETAGGYLYKPVSAQLINGKNHHKCGRYILFDDWSLGRNLAEKP